MTPFPTPTMIATNGIELEVFQAGQGGIPLVLCHGWPELAYSWRYQIAPLVDAGYHCIIPNQRGYGRSDKPFWARPAVRSPAEFQVHCQK